MDNEYILSFSSFYKAAYARDVLDESGINSVLRKLPSELVKSCSTGLYLRIDSIQRARQIFEEKTIVPRGIYQIRRDGKTRGRVTYIRV
ncbi:MAG TPA: DUF3343 domain-containing protein [Anaerovoracaceae bacterium]|nr:DUF3343 domain-containing protein [Anaerovoracaceae bacterium]